MYGLIIEAMVESIKAKYGKNIWEEVKRKAKVDQDFFSTHQQYSEAIVQKILRSLSIVTGTSYLILTFHLS
jgi:hypothetical protein